MNNLENIFASSEAFQKTIRNIPLALSEENSKIILWSTKYSKSNLKFPINFPRDIKDFESWNKKLSNENGFVIKAKTMLKAIKFNDEMYNYFNVIESDFLDKIDTISGLSNIHIYLELEINKLTNIYNLLLDLKSTYEKSCAEYFEFEKVEFLKYTPLCVSINTSKINNENKVKDFNFKEYLAGQNSLSNKRNKFDLSSYVLEQLESDKSSFFLLYNYVDIYFSVLDETSNNLLHLIMRICRQNKYLIEICFDIISEPPFLIKKTITKSAKVKIKDDKCFSQKQIGIAYCVMNIVIDTKNCNDILSKHSSTKSAKLLQKRLTNTRDLVKLSENKSADKKHLNDLIAAERLVSGMKNEWKNKNADTEIATIIADFKASYEGFY